MVAEVDYFGGGRSVCGIDISAPSNNKFVCGFKPKKILYVCYTNATVPIYLNQYDADVSKTTVSRAFYNTSSSTYTRESNIAIGSNQSLIASIDDDGFTVAGSPSHIYYVATDS